MSKDSQMLDDFVRVGREILSCDWAAHYGTDYALVAPSPPGVGYAQPGFLGSDYRGVVFIGQNPGAGVGRDDVHRIWKRAFEGWHNEGTVAAYSKVFRLWQSDLHAWDVWKTYVRPILGNLGFTEDQIGYLNLCKNATIGNTKPTERMYWNDWVWTEKQLKLLQPRVVVAGGKEVARQLNARWSEPCLVRTQNRARARPGLTYAALQRERAREADELAGEIRSALQ